MEREILNKQEDLSRFHLEARNQRKTKAESEAVRILDTVAKKNTFTDLKVESTAEEKDGFIFNVSFKNFFKKTSHKGSITVKSSEDQVQLQKEIEEQLKAIPALPQAPIPARANFDVKDLKFIQEGEVVYVRSGHIGNICAFTSNDFKESNKDLIEQQIKDFMLNLNETWNMNFIYNIPALTEVLVIGEQKSADPVIPKDLYENYLQDNKIEKADLDNEFMKPKWNRLDENQKIAIQKQVEDLQNFVETSVIKSIKNISTVEGAKLLKTPMIPKFEFNADKTISGSFYVRASFAHENDFKTHTFEIKVDANKVLMPSKSDFIDEIKTTEGAIKASDRTIGLEIKNLVASIQPQEIIKQGITKEAQASLSPVETSGYAARVDVNKTQLPESTKVGDIIYIDGFPYRVTSGDNDKLSERGVGVYWTLIQDEHSEGIAEPVAAPAW